ncbi:hypothetical protein MPSEU_000885200 [Mayamaea pseudoterrestris]|nr:hypothetical protein MPSEU_000885200 [Mayamaea pseudoterrestris]
MRSVSSVLVLLSLIWPADSFSQYKANRIRRLFGASVRSDSSGALFDAATSVNAVDDRPATTAATEDLQTKLISYGASYNRGFGASSGARKRVDELIKQIEARNQETFAARGITGAATYDTASTTSPLTGAWRMVWTTALDVLSLEANPFATTGAIYQVFTPPIVTNVIDFAPRIQSLLPPSLVPSSLLRANVETRAYERINQPNRVGLEFCSVQLQPVQALGMNVTSLLPPLGVDLPRIPGVSQSENGPGYFDVTFLDDKFLIIRQQGDGLFCLVKVDSIDP